jgi:nitroreductase
LETAAGLQRGAFPLFAYLNVASQTVRTSEKPLFQAFPVLCAIADTARHCTKDGMKIDTTWVGWFDPNVMKKNFPQMEGYDLIAIFPVGYALPEAHPSHMHADRKKIDEIVSYL